MTLRDKIRANAKPFLQPGEEIQAVVPAQTIRQYWSLISFWLVARDTYRVIVATDRRILLCRSGRFTETAVRGVLAELPRRTVIGPAHGLWYRTDALRRAPLHQPPIPRGRRGRGQRHGDAELIAMRHLDEYRVELTQRPQ